jgi:hypothetical protein
MIFGGPAAYNSKHQRKLERRQAYDAELAKPTFLDWFDSAITFDRDDHPDRVLWLGQYLLAHYRSHHWPHVAH